MSTDVSRRAFLWDSVASMTTIISAPFLALTSDVESSAAVPLVTPEKLVKLMEGISIELKPDVVPIDRPTVVWADTIELDGTIRTKGHDLTLVARNVVFREGAVINTTPDKPAQSYPAGSQASDGREPGENGKDGSDGGNGGHAGNVTIYADRILGSVSVIADGQNGGNAQGGGNGNSGRRGPNPNALCVNGNRGGPGGIGGLAGDPGNGGNGGRVLLVSTDPDAVTLGSVSTAPGTPGMTAKHGSPGEGGPGGKPGEDKWRTVIQRIPSKLL